jgi:anti-anti-sigma factor
MDVKIDTKEKFTVITPLSETISASMTEKLRQILQSYQTKEIPHVILNIENVIQCEESVLELIYEMQQSFYNENFSFVICNVNTDILKVLQEKDMLDSMNITPSESEAWDIVQMEEIERELLNDFED